MHKVLEGQLEVLLVAFIDDLLDSAVEMVFVKGWQFFDDFGFFLSFGQVAVLANWIDLDGLVFEQV